MKPEQFIRDQGLPLAESALEWHAALGQKHNLGDVGNVAGVKVNMNQLDKVVGQLKLIETCGGIDSCRKKLSTRDECKPNATHFAIHPEKPHLIQMYRRNEPKLEPNYSFADLKKAVAVHESIYGGGDA